MKPHFDVIIVGAGAAGCTAALSLAPLKVGLIFPYALSHDCSSLWSQGGIAAAVAKGDNPLQHARDTDAAADGAANKKAVLTYTQAAPRIIEFLEQNNVQFSKGSAGFDLSREGGHGQARVLKAKSGDSFGQSLMPALWQRLKTAGHVTLIDDTIVSDIFLKNDQVAGVISDRGIIRSAHVVLATGGAAALYEVTSNPSSNMGAGLAMAVRAGAEIRDLEFMQFHPTVVCSDKINKSPLISEALRGHGARLCNDRQEYFMNSLHPLADMAPRDIVSRVIDDQLQNGRQVYLDCRDIDISEFQTLRENAAAMGLDPAYDLLPVRPAAHYHMGGIATDLDGATSKPGLWAIGEAACTGFHGANRLASNSLLEAVIMGRMMADSIRKTNGVPTPTIPFVKTAKDLIDNIIPAQEHEKVIKAMRRAMTENVGIVRDAAGLMDAIAFFDDVLANYTGLDNVIANMAGVCRLISMAALQRRESRGGHYRRDYPYKDASYVAINELEKGERDAITAPA